MRWSGPTITDEVLFKICEKLINNETATRIAKDLKKEMGVSITREQVYPLLRRAVKQRFLRLCPPLEHSLERRLAQQYPHAHFRIVNVLEDAATVEHVASAAAELILSLIRHLAESRDTVHLGLASGYILKLLSKNLGQLLQTEPKLPGFVLHALSSGIVAQDPTTSPVAFLSFFNDVPTDVRSIGLFAPALVRWDEYEKTKELPGIREAFSEKENIDIVIVSMADSSDEHGHFRSFLSSTDDDVSDEDSAMEKLHEAGWVGDLHWKPFSEEGPIDVETRNRSLTLFEIDELVEWTRVLDKSVVLVVGPCGRCGKRKSRALRALLNQPNLWAFNHLVTDVRTAQELL